MNDFLGALILAVIQGITEWLPVSSSSHIILISKLIDYPHSLLFSIALHFGTLMAVFVYFGKDITDILQDLFMARFYTRNGKIGLYLIIATIPALIAGFFLKNFLISAAENLLLMVLGLGITSMLLFMASLDISKNSSRLNTFKALIIGLAQVASLFRGISRSGTTISAALFLGLNEKEAVKFSFLLSIPVIFGANIVALGQQQLTPKLFIPALVSFVVGIATINLSFRYILSNRKNLRWFGLYVLLLALGIMTYLLLT